MSDRDFREGHWPFCALWKDPVKHDCSCGVTAQRVAQYSKVREAVQRLRANQCGR